MIKRLSSTQRRNAFLLLLVLLVVSGISLTAVSLSESMLMSFEETLITIEQFKRAVQRIQALRPFDCFLPTTNSRAKKLVAFGTILLIFKRSTLSPIPILRNCAIFQFSRRVSTS